MKKLLIVVVALVLATIVGCSATKQSVIKVIPTPATTSTPLLVTPGAVATSKDGKVVYKDGSYYIAIAADAQGYYANGKMSIKGGKITNVEWSIIDGKRNRAFDKTYEEVFAADDVYIQQCRNNLQGMVNFVPQLVESQDIDKVDAVSSATWAYNKFKTVVNTMLKQAKASN